MKNKKDKLKIAIFILIVATLIISEIIFQSAKMDEIVETVADGVIQVVELKTETTTESIVIESFTYAETTTKETACSDFAKSTTAPATTATTVPAGEKKKLDGKFKITCYTPYSDGGRWGYATSTGVRSKHLATCAVDPSVIPLDSTIEVNGLTLLCCDIGGMVKGKHIDIFYDGTGSEARAWLTGFGESQEVEIYA